MNEERFLNHIAQRLGRSRHIGKPERSTKGAPDFWNEYRLTPEQCVERFIENWTQVGGKAMRCPDVEYAWQYIADITKALSGESMVVSHLKPFAPYWSEQLLSHMNVHHLETSYGEGEAGRRAQIDLAAQAAVGVIAADYAVAYTGTIVTMSGPQQGRTVSLLPPTLIVLIQAEQIKTRLGEVMIELDALGRTGLPAGIHFISGPSRSADIENDLTIGVHGPGDVHALIVDSLV